jgi:phospholipid/cholesterol/gamma-HCH transport system substrate-binding protein
MKLPFDRLGRLSAVIAFLGAAALVLIYFTAGTAVRVPVVEKSGYKAIVVLEDADNIVPASRVRMAGINVGEVRNTTVQSGGVRVELAITNDDVPALHEGVKIRVGARSLVEDNYLDITDGDGPKLASGSSIPPSAVQTSTQVDDVLRSLDPKTRAELGSLLMSVGKGTGGTQDDIDSAMAGLGALGRDGHTALDAIAAQSEDLRALGRQTQVLLKALDTGEGQIASLVDNAHAITKSTSGQSEAIADSIQKLPSVLKNASAATDSIHELSSAATPVAANLKSASPYLTDALQELPSTTDDLAGLLPPLSSTLDQAPKTLHMVPTFGKDVRALVPGARDIVRDVNPMLKYVRPYGPDLAAFFTNFNAVLAGQDEAGVHYARLLPHLNEQSVQSPLKLEALGTYYNPIPAPGSGAHPGPFTGKYPRVERDPK